MLERRGVTLLCLVLLFVVLPLSALLFVLPPTLARKRLKRVARLSKIIVYTDAGRVKVLPR